VLVGGIFTALGSGEFSVSVFRRLNSLDRAFVDFDLPPVRYRVHDFG